MGPAWPDRSQSPDPADASLWRACVMQPLLVEAQGVLMANRIMWLPSDTSPGQQVVVYEDDVLTVWSQIHKRYRLNDERLFLVAHAVPVGGALVDAFEDAGWQIGLSPQDRIDETITRLLAN